MVDITNSTTILDLLPYTVSDLFRTLEWLAGGVFGIYLIMLVLKYLQYRNIKKSFVEIKERLSSIEQTISKLGKKKK